MGHDSFQIKAFYNFEFLIKKQLKVKTYIVFNDLTLRPFNSITFRPIKIKSFIEDTCRGGGGGEEGGNG
jgi:hypothetical protein